MYAKRCKEQVANAGAQKWDYCAPKINYADVRKRVGNAFVEKANEISDAIAVVQGLSKEATRLLRRATELFRFAWMGWGSQACACISFGAPVRVGCGIVAYMMGAGVCTPPRRLAVPRGHLTTFTHVPCVRRGGFWAILLRNAVKGGMSQSLDIVISWADPA